MHSFPAPLASFIYFIKLIDFLFSKKKIKWQKFFAGNLIPAISCEEFPPNPRGDSKDGE